VSDVDGLWEIGEPGVSARISEAGAELRSLRDAKGAEMLWQAGPAWPRCAPILFPIVGRLAGDQLRHDGHIYAMTQHGFARDSRFAWLEREASRCRLVLEDDAATRARYPFPFRLEVGYAVAESTLTMELRIDNPGTNVLPASVGAHPAFRWPLADGVAKAAHRLDFALPEPAPVRRLQNGLLLSEVFPSPVVGRSLPLDESLFAADALILDQPASGSVRYTAPGAASIDIAWEGARELGLWSKPGADFLCIEPWHGMASPVDFDGEFGDKPGLMLIGPGEHRLLTVRIRLRDGP
jgi:galactose mutarotase-like enzyme